MKLRIKGFALLLGALILMSMTGSVYSYPERAFHDRSRKEFSLKDLSSKKVNLSDFRGKVVVVNFFATWCGPCRLEIPELVDIYNQNKKKGLIILGVSLDMEKAPFVLKGFIRDMKIPYPILIGTQEVAERYEISGIPTTVVINKEGKIYKRFQGLVPTEHLEMAINALL